MVQHTHTSFTPGPWTANLESDHGDYTIWGPGPDDTFLANVGTAPSEDRVVAFDVSRANARLIARAPALLAENKRLRTLLQEALGFIVEGSSLSSDIHSALKVAP